MKNWIRIYSLAWIIWVQIPSFLAAQHQECYLLMAGRGATATGQVYLAHNNDLSGEEASMLVLQIYKGFAEGDSVAINAHGVAIAGGKAHELWDSAQSTFYFGSPTIPEGYDCAPPDYDEHAAFWQFKALSDSLKYGFPKMRKRWSMRRDLFESQEISLQHTIITGAREIYLNQPEKM
ncbi:MAG: hypothetical protein ISS17_05335 [Bacteroidales bacterium]|nr:hypothetical protein [Bacteroidales bacterium]